MKNPSPFELKYKDSNPEDGHDGYCAYLRVLQAWEDWVGSQENKKLRKIE